MQNQIQKGWRKVKINDVAITVTDFVANGSFASLRENVKYNSEKDYAILVRTKDLLNNFSHDLVYVNKHAYNFLSKSKLFGGEIILSNVGNVGDVFLCPKLNQPMTLGPNAIILKTKEDDSFYYYYFKSRIGQYKLRSLVSGSSQPKFNKTHFRKLELEVPNVELQKRISSLLSKFSNKIEINSKIADTLSKMAQALFKEWFVDFKFPGYKKTKFIHSELGKIPEGWKVNKLSDLVKPQYGFTESASEDKIGPKFLRVTDINKTDRVDWANVPYCKISEEEFKKYKLEKGDIVVARMADPGKVAIIEENIDAIFASYLIRLKIANRNISSYFLFYYLTSRKYQGFIFGASTGTTRCSANAKVITDVSLAVPPKEIIEKFEYIVSSIRNKVSFCIKENQKLTNMRDLLLSKLVKGEIKI